MTLEMIQGLYEYHRWANRRLFESAETPPPAERSGLAASRRRRLWRSSVVGDSDAWRPRPSRVSGGLWPSSERPADTATRS